MGILEKLRPQPPWKHSDPAVRAAAVYELGADDREALYALAREDQDARVRRAAISRVHDVDVLGEVARTDPDEDIRVDAIRALAGLAAEASALESASPVLQRLGDLGRGRELSAIARSAASVDVRGAAVDLLQEARALGSVSRHAEDGATRLRALGRLTDADELANVACKSEHTDVAIAALERVTDREALASVAQRARSKVAARRARLRLRALDEAAQPPKPEAARMSEDDRARALGIIQRVEEQVVVADPVAAASALADLRLAWAELQADTDVEPVLQQQFEAALDAGREAVGEREAEREAELQRARLVAREQADRVAMCEELERLDGPDSLDRVAELRARWDALPAMPSDYAASLTRRFQDASREYERRERHRVLAVAAASRLDTLAGELEQLLASEQPDEEVVARWRGLRRDAEMLREHAAANAPAAERLEQAVAALEQKEHAAQERRSKQEQEQLRRLQQVCRHAETLAVADALTLKAGDRALRDIRDALEAKTPLPTKRDRQEIQARLEAARLKLAPRVQELRDADEWQRFANVQVQEELCTAMEALKSSQDVEDAARKMREYQGRWKQVAAAPRAQGEALWRRFKTAQDSVYAMCEAFFAAQAVERAQNLTKKQELVQRVEALADSTDWMKTTVEIQKLQAEWKAIGAVSRGHEKSIWDRFRGACDRFFTRRQEDLKKRKDEWASNLARKEALCAQAEALSESTDWDAAAAALRRLQQEWKGIGPVRKSKSEVIWQRFRTACDRFFDRYKHKDYAHLQGKLAEREAIAGSLESLRAGASGATEPPPDLYAHVQTARATWQQAAELPRALLEPVAARYQQALNGLVADWPNAFTGTDLDPALTTGRMEKLIARIEKLLAAHAPVAKTASMSPTERLAQQLRERLASNTISGSGKAGEMDESRWRAAEQEVRTAQQQWARLAPVPPDIAGPLNERFQRACRQFFDQRRRSA